MEARIISIGYWDFHHHSPVLQLLHQPEASDDRLLFNWRREKLGARIISIGTSIIIHLCLNCFINTSTRLLKTA